MSRKQAPAKKKSKRSAPAVERQPVADASGAPATVGEVVEIDLDSVAPNSWNSNRPTDRQKAAIRQGLVEDGWLASNAMTIWGTDERGRKRDLIIDAEHRWHEARALGMKRGPAMVMRGITEAEARALTIKLYRRRGEHDADLLAAAVREIDGKLSVNDLALSLGFEEKAFAKLVATQEPPAPPAEFPEFDETIETNHECPKCGFKFS